MATLVAGLDNVLQRSIKAELNDVRSGLYSSASKPDRPWLPFVFIAGRFISEPLIFLENRSTERQILVFQISYYVLKIVFLITWVLFCRRSGTVQFFPLIITLSDVGSTTLFAEGLSEGFQFIHFSSPI